MSDQNQLLREALQDIEQAHDLSLDLDHYAGRQVLVSLADKIKVALAQRPAPGVPEGWRNVIAGTLKTDPWDSARVADYNSGWNDCQRKTLRGLERLAAAQAKGGE